jgi:tetratricopeptide (TPR) repeat protein
MKTILSIRAIVFCCLWTSLIALAQAQKWEKLNQQGMEAYNAGDYKEAIRLFEKALKQAEKEFGKNHENYATACNNLADLYYAQGRYSGARPLYTIFPNLRSPTCSIIAPPAIPY